MPDTLLHTIKQNGKYYLMEAAGIAGFVILAGGLTIFLEHPAMPVMKTWLWHYPFLRRVLLGIGIGLYVTGTIKLFGKLSGTHVNPSVTGAFLRLGNITFINALNYVIAQFIGALAGFFLLKWLANDLFSYPSIDYGISKPQPPHSLLTAFIAEFVISFLLMITTLMMSGSRKWEKHIAVVTGILLALYIIFELPYSGMSMNPARSFAAALGTNQWDGLWIYFTSPILATLLAAEVFLIWKKKRLNGQHPDHRNISIYPVIKKVL